MGEHSIIISKTRAIDRESGSRVVCQLYRDFTAGGPTRSAGGSRSGIERAGASSFDRRNCGGGSAPGQCETSGPSERIYSATNENPKNHRCSSNSIPRNHRRTLKTFRTLVLLVLSFFGHYRKSVISPSRKNRENFHVNRVLVCLVIIGLLRPVVAVPATSNAAAAAAAAATAARGSSGNGEATRAIIMTRNREIANAVENTDEETRYENAAVGTTMNRRRLGVEDPTGDYYHDDDDDDEDEETMQLPAPPPPPSPSLPSYVSQHSRESGLESRSRLGEAELDTIRRSIVEGLGLERIPDPSKANVSQTEYRRAHEEYLNRLHSRAGKDDRLRRLHTFHPAERLPETIATTMTNRTRRSVYEPSIDESDEVFDDDALANVVYFTMDDLDADDGIVDHANIRFLVDPSDTLVTNDYRDVSLYRLTPDSRRLVSRQTLPRVFTDPRWIEIDATEIASMWHDYGVENFGVELRFRRNSDVVASSSVRPKISLPAMNVFVTRSTTNDDNPGRGGRTKRRASPEHLMSLHKGRRTDCRGENKKCCRHEMTVIFKDIKGFEFIVQPKNFDAGYCKGRCPPRYNPAHHHALLQSLIWKADKRKAPRPCCAPSKLDELEILYFDENDPTKLKVSSWKNMKVLECACS